MRPWFLALSLFACGPAAEAPPAATPPAVVTARPAPPPKVKTDAEKTVLDVAVGSPDHTTLVAAVKATDLVNALASPGGIYTVFAPTDAAFAALPPGTLDELLKPEKKATLKSIVQHHAMVPIVEKSAMKDGDVLGMSDGKSLTVHVVNGEVLIEDAHILAEVRAINGIVYVVDKVLVPAT